MERQTESAFVVCEKHVTHWWMSAARYPVRSVVITKKLASVIATISFECRMVIEIQMEENGKDLDFL